MDSEFKIKLPKVGLVDLVEFDRMMDNRISSQVRSDFKSMDNMFVEVYRKQVGNRSMPPLRSLGKMTIRSIREKFA